MNRLSRFGIKRLAGWWCALNCYEWPKDLPIHPPLGFKRGANDFRLGDASEFKDAWRSVQSAIVWHVCKPYWAEYQEKKSALK